MKKKLIHLIKNWKIQERQLALDVLEKTGKRDYLGAAKSQIIAVAIQESRLDLEQILGITSE